MKYSSIIIAGPTASGKSGFAHELAKQINGAIINADSVQIYRGIESISASPFAGKKEPFNEIDGVPYRLFSMFPLNEHISVAEYMTLAARAYYEVLAMGKIPIFVGGTGYYIDVLINGISQIPEIDEEVRNRAREIVDKEINAAKQLLPADFHANDPQRIARALEVFLQTGIHLSEWQKKPRIGAVAQNALRILIMPDKEELLTRISSRIPEMLSGGAISEGRFMINNDLDTSRAIGADQVCEMLRGFISQEEAIENWTIKTKQYAKRQRTWFKNQYNPDYQILRAPKSEDIECVLETLKDLPVDTVDININNDTVDA